MQQPTLFLMFGYPGAGKTTAAKLISELTGATRLSSDDLRIELFPKPTYTEAEHSTVYKTLDQRVEQLLSEGKSVVYDANLNRYVHRAEKYAIAKKTNVRPVLIWVKVPRDFSKERAVIRGHHHLVPEDETFESMFERVANTLEEPSSDEPVYTLNGTYLTPDTISEMLKRL
jgi:predicted kinase